MEVNIRKFEKISIEQYEKDLKEKCEYSDITLPSRSTKHSAGYDFKSPIEFELKPGEIIKVPTGIKAAMNDDEFLAILVRSSMGFKYNTVDEEEEVCSSRKGGFGSTNKEGE